VALTGFSALSSGRKLITDDIACGELSPILATASDLQVYSRDTGASEVSEQTQREVSFPVAVCMTAGPHLASTSVATSCSAYGYSRMLVLHTCTIFSQ